MTDDEFWADVFGTDGPQDEEPDPEDCPAPYSAPCLRCGTTRCWETYEEAMAETDTVFCDDCVDEMLEEDFSLLE